MLLQHHADPTDLEIRHLSEYLLFVLLVVRSEREYYYQNHSSRYGTFFKQKVLTFFCISPQKHILWCSLEDLDDALLMSSHNLCFHGEIKKDIMRTSPLIWS